MDPVDKICTVCLQRVLLSNFHKMKHGKFGLRAACNDCRSKEYSIYCKNNEKERLRKANFRKTPRGRLLDRAYKDTPRHRWLNMKSKSKIKHQEISDISFEKYPTLLHSSYYFCEKDLMKETGVCLDRRDTTRGYMCFNVVPACMHCNCSRRNSKTIEEFKALKKQQKALK